MALPLRDVPEAAATLARTFGARGLFLRGRHEVRRAVGRFKSSPSIAAVPAGALQWLAVDRERLRRATDTVAAGMRATHAEGGQYEAYRWDWRLVPATASEWNTHAGATRAAFASSPWWEVPHLARASGDIKDLWEPGRFSWVFDLVRGYVALGRERSAEVFFAQLDQFIESNPPFLGVQWSCGQEAAIRAVALLYAEANLRQSAAATPRRLERLALLLAWSGERIADAIGYAISQRNNHAISEALGLALLGERFRGVHPDAETWSRRGRSLLDMLLHEQFASDGWYIQHSFTYARLALDQAVIGQRLLRATGDGYSAATLARLHAAHDLLVGNIDGRGDLPNHGANDGAFVHPVTLAPYRDFRPTVTATAAMFGFPLPSSVARDDETLAWLGTVSPPPGGEAPTTVTGSSGWLAARRACARIFFRAGRYTSRPAHMDSLHLDVRVNDRPYVADAGSFAYSARAPWHTALADAVVHNGPLIDGKEPGLRGPRFLWLKWPRAHLTDIRDGPLELFATGARADVERCVRFTDDLIEVLDRPTGEGDHDIEVNWLLAPGVPESVMESDAVREVIHANEGRVDGWISQRYGQRDAGTLVRLRAKCARDAPLRTVIHLRR